MPTPSIIFPQAHTELCEKKSITEGMFRGIDDSLADLAEELTGEIRTATLKMYNIPYTHY